MTDQEPIRVRLAVAVDKHGYVFAVNTKSLGDDVAMLDVIGDCDGEPLAKAFVEADIPRTPTVKARVVESEVKP